MMVSVGLSAENNATISVNEGWHRYPTLDTADDVISWGHFRDDAALQGLFAWKPVLCSLMPPRHAMRIQGVGSPIRTT